MRIAETTGRQMRVFVEKNCLYMRIEVALTLVVIGRAEGQQISLPRALGQLVSGYRLANCLTVVPHGCGQGWHFDGEDSAGDQAVDNSVDKPACL